MPRAQKGASSARKKTARSSADRATPPTPATRRPPSTRKGGVARRAAKVVYDCVTCGACCYNPDENREVGYIDYIEVEPFDRVMKKPELVRRLVVLDANFQPHMKFSHHQRCVALEGRLGVKVGCGIYKDRPASCRSFEAGSRRCRKYRKERGVDP